jgi:gliding motility-associated-like protein
MVWLDILVETCKFRDSILISEIAIPELDLGQDTSICDNSELVVSLQNNYIFEWQDGSNSAEYTITKAGLYVVKASDNGCVNSDTLEVDVLPSPVFSLGDDIEVCASETVSIKVPLGFSSFSWDDGSQDSSRIASEIGAYWIEVQEEGCTARDTIEVGFIPLPDINLGGDTTVCDDEVYLVVPTDRSNGDLFWQDGSTEEYFEVRSPGLITATVFDGLCENSDSIAVTFRECTYFDIFIPNAFSPNGDGYNDKFEVFVPENLIIESYSISIFDRWGTRVFQSSDIEEGWDGYLQTKGLNTGVFVYVVQIKYVDEDGPGEKLIKGDFAIVK